MKPLDLLQFFIDAFKGTEFEGYANTMLFVFFVTFMMAAIRALLPKSGITKAVKFVYENVGLGLDEIKRNMELAPGAQSAIDRVSPYVELVAYTCYFITFFSFSILIGILPTTVDVPSLQGILLVSALLLGGLLISRFCLAKATWAWHHIKNR